MGRLPQVILEGYGNVLVLAHPSLPVVESSSSTLRPLRCNCQFDLPRSPEPGPPCADALGRDALAAEAVEDADAFRDHALPATLEDAGDPQEREREHVEHDEARPLHRPRV